MEADAPLLEARDLAVAVPTAQGLRDAVGPVHLAVGHDETVAILGESGTGKSLLALALGWLAPPGSRLRGEVLLSGTPISGLNEAQLARIRGRRIGFVLQEPGTALNPVYSVGFQLREVLRLHRGLGRREATHTAKTLLADLGFPDPGEVLRAFPHQLSGGQQQRVLLALAMAPEPSLLVADEPTAALDPVLRTRVLELLTRWRETRGASLVLISHSTATARALARRTAVLYAGEVVEEGPPEEVLGHPLHPYTRFLTGDGAALADPEMPPPAPGSWGRGCRLRPRCSMARPECGERHPALLSVDGRRLRCPPAAGEAR